MQSPPLIFSKMPPKLFLELLASLNPFGPLLFFLLSLLAFFCSLDSFDGFVSFCYFRLWLFSVRWNNSMNLGYHGSYNFRIFSVLWLLTKAKTSFVGFNLVFFGGFLCHVYISGLEAWKLSIFNGCFAHRISSSYVINY